jgi:ABC-type branched-subunit amino acid transport system substrate-binding protein
MVTHATLSILPPAYRPRAGRLWPATAAALLVAGCISPGGGEPGDTLKIGAILPFTGELAASGPNIESALLMVSEAVNAGGGLAGKRLELVTRDSSADLVRGLDAVHQLVEDEGVFALIGPEDDELAWVMSPLVRERGIVTVSGGVTSPRFTNEGSGAHWFRTIPAARALGSVLAQQVRQDGSQRPTILHANDEYGKGFAAMVREEYQALAGTTPSLVSFEPNQASYSVELGSVLGQTPDAVILIAYPKAGATILQEWAPLRHGERWYFSHTLKNQSFLLNVPSDSVEGMKGVSPALSKYDQPVFARKFSDRWQQDAPLPAAFFNYDALALLALAIEKAYVDGGAVGLPTSEQLAVQVLDVSRNPRGKVVGWDHLGDGLHLIRFRDQSGYVGINYRGVSGTLDLTDKGEITDGLVEVWTVAGNQITTLGVVTATTHAP